MDIIQRNFFRIMCSGAFATPSSLEAMSAFKWRRLIQMVEAQQVMSIFIHGIERHAMDEGLNLPETIIAEIRDKHEERKTLAERIPKSVRLSNTFLNRRLKKVIYNELHSIDTSTETLDLLKIIVSNSETMFTRGMNLGGIITMGEYLRTRGNKVDFVKLDNWLKALRLYAMAELQGNVLISVFGFEEDEIPFVSKSDPNAYQLTLRSISDLAKDTAHEWHFRQNAVGFVKNNSAVLHRNARRSLRYIRYAPLETTSNFVSNFVRSLSEIEE